MANHWTCPFCNHDAIVRDDDCSFGGRNLVVSDPVEGHKHIAWYYVVCPNKDCRKYSLRVGVLHLERDQRKQEWVVGEMIRSWNLVPNSTAKPFPDYVPKAILADYEESCLIADLSPKASATLARRCLQGIIRDFWTVKPGRLVDEIAQIKDKTDPLTWDAIEAVRKVGNIGAHMEKDIDLIIDVDPQEAQMLIGLIELLIKDWYVAREDRRNRLLAIKTIAAEKEAQKRGET